MMSVLSEAAPPQVKAEWAFKVLTMMRTTFLATVISERWWRQSLTLGRVLVQRTLPGLTRTRLPVLWRMFSMKLISTEQDSSHSQSLSRLLPILLILHRALELNYKGRVQKTKQKKLVENSTS